uniref:Reverse transcriptase domain-containing protein n=1 Tax=Tanacetum cinerariifolium TaxID=118510 RepID=A0A6L2LBE4_TANCI|nr:reverse transcriptase domain-containing protein [Tanacetum cinerariifolium]
MSTRSSARNLFPPLDNPELTILRRSRVDPTLLNDFEMATDENGDPPVPDLRTMEELCHPTLIGLGGPIALIAIQATTFGLKNDIIQQDTSAQRSESSSSITSFFDRKIIALKAEMEDINKNLMKVLQINQQLKAVAHNCETCGGPHSYYDCPATVGQTQNVYAAGAYQGGNSYQPQGASHGQNPPLAYQAPAYQAPSYQALVHQPSIPQLQVVTTIKFTNYMKANDAILKNMPTNMTSLTNSNLELKNMFGQFIKMNTASSSGSRTLPSNTIINPKEDLKVWNKLSLPELSPTCMTLELADRLISCPVGVAEDVFVKVGMFHFPADFLVVDFDADPRVLLILGRSFLKTRRALIDVYEGELTLRVGKEAVTFNLDQTARYSANYNAMLVNRIDLIDVAYEEYSQEVLGFSVSANPTSSTKPIISNSSPNFTPFRDSDFLLEETDAFLAINDEPISQEINGSYYDSKGDILLLEEFLNDDPLSPPLLPQELKVVEPTNEKSSIDKPPVVELKDLPPHPEYAFLEGGDKFPVIIEKYLKNEEKTALIMFLKSHKQALAWQLSNIKVIDPEFFKHKILMEDDFKPAVQHQRRVNPKIHEFAKVMLKYCVTHRLATAYHPQTSGQVEVSNRGLKRILERTVSENPASWSDKLDDALWAFHTAFKTPIGCTPYKLVYEKACHLPIELEHKAYWALKHCNYDLLTAGDHYKVQLNELNKHRDQAYGNSLIYKEKTKRLHDSKIKDRIFKVDDQVLFNSRLKIFLSKLKTCWSGPFTITQVFPYGTVELSQTDKPNFKVNGHRLKHYFVEDIPKMVVPNFQTFPKD